MKKLSFIFLIAVGLSACTTSSVLVNIQSPAGINLPENIRNVVVVNKSCSSKDNLAGEIVEALIAVERVSEHRQGSEYCIEGLVNILTNSERFTLKNISGIELKGTGASTFPIPLDWNEVKSICGSYDSDALLVLETFDFDSRVSIGTPIARTRKVKKIKIQELRYPAKLTISIESGWRIYDVNKKQIIDENKFIDVKDFSAWGNSFEEAKLNLPSERRVIKELGLLAGEEYGFRISPKWIKVNRTYYIGKSEDLKLAKSYVKKGDWDAAIDIWKDLVDSPDKKIAGRSAYNMAIATEIRGELDIAIEWADKAGKLGEKKAYSYINILQSRKMDEQKIK